MNRMARRTWLGMTLAGLGLAVGLAMGMGAQPAGKKPAKRAYVIGLVAKSSTNPVFLAARQGAEDAARDIGKKMGVEIKIDWRTPVAEDGQKQAEFIEQLAAGGADGIAVSASDAARVKTAIDAAVAKNVAVSTFDSDVPTSQRFAYFGTDDFACGQQVAAELVKTMGEKGTVAILAGNQNAPNLQARVKGVRDGLAKYSGIKILDTVYHPETPQDAVRKVEEIMAAHPDITGWAMVGGWPLMTENAMEKVKGRAKVVAVDALPQQIKYVERGEVEVLLAQQVYEWGYKSVEMIMNYVVNGEKPSEPVVRAELMPVRKANAAEYAKNWEKWLKKK